MAETNTEMKQTLGLTGLTMNAMTLIAPGAFLWLTFAGQSAAGATGPAMWMGILFATVLCLATAVCYAEMAKLYPGTGSSYYFAEQSFLNHETAWPNLMSSSNPGPMFMMLVAIVFSFAVAYIAHRGVNGSTSVNIAINIIQKIA